MSRYLTSAAAKEFDTMVKQAYQAKGGRIRPTIIQRTQVMGDTYNFRLMQSGIATEKTVSSADVAVMDIEHQLIQAGLKNYTAAEYTDIFDQATVNFDEKQALADSVAMAIKRREDQLIITAFNQAAVDSKNFLNNRISGSAQNLTVEAVLKASELLDDAYADGQKYMLITPSMRSSLLNNAKTTQSFYVDVKALVTGQLEEFAGFKFIYVESSRKEGGLPKLTSPQRGSGSAGDRLAFAYVENAAGIAIGVDMRTEITYVPEKTSWLTNCLFKAGAAVIDPAGLVKIACKEA